MTAAAGHGQGEPAKWLCSESSSGRVERTMKTMSLAKDRLTASFAQDSILRKARPETMDELVEGLHELFATDRVNVDHVRSWMESYPGNKGDWKKFEKTDKYRYTRNLVDSGNGKFNLMLLAWGEGMGSGIHDHADAHCFMKILDGSLKETLYDWPNSEGDAMEVGKAEGEEEQEEQAAHNETEMHKRQTNIYEVGSVAYINDSIGLHRVENSSDTSRSVSLHVYAPPFDECRCFDERSGKNNKTKVTFFSKYGERTPFKTVQSAVFPSENN